MTTSSTLSAKEGGGPRTAAYYYFGRDYLVVGAVYPREDIRYIYPLGVCHTVAV